MRIAILTDGIYPFVIGGMQKHSYYLAKFLAIRGHEITLIHCVPSGTRVPSNDEVMQALDLPANCKMEIFGMNFPVAGVTPGHYLKESYLYSRTIFRRFKERWTSFDFIYAKGFVAWHLLHEKSRGFVCPPVGIKFHGYEMFQPASNLKVKLQHWLLRKPVKWNNDHADYIFSYGGKITSIIQSLGTPKGKIVEIPTGIESAWLMKGTPALNSGTRHFLFVGRYERRKGIEELTEVLASMLQSEDFHFHFIGPIPPSKKIKSKQITYHGSLSSKDEIQSVMSGCQVLVTPSHSEGMPNVILEGMSRGLAVIATDVGAVPAMVDSRNGWLIAPLNKEELKQALIEAIQASAETLQQKQIASRNRVQSEFTWEEISIRTEEAISRLVAQQSTMTAV